MRTRRIEISLWTLLTVLLIVLTGCGRQTRLYSNAFYSIVLLSGEKAQQNSDYDTVLLLDKEEIASVTVAEDFRYGDSMEQLISNWIGMQAAIVQNEIWRTGTLIEFHIVIQDESAAQQIHYIYLSDDDLLIDVYVYDNDHEDTIENILDSMEILYQAANAETEAASGENIQEETGIPDTEDTKTAIRRTYGEVTLLDEKDNSALYENVRAMLELRDNLHGKLMSIGTDYVTTVFTPYYLDSGIFKEQDDKLYRELSDTPYIKLQTDTV